MGSNPPIAKVLLSSNYFLKWHFLDKVLWHIFGFTVQQHNNKDKEIKRRKPRNLAELEAVVKEAWAAIPNDRFVRLIKSMPRRCQEVIKNKGYSTSY